MSEPTPDEREAWELATIRQRRSRLVAKPIGSVVRRLMESSSYGETQAAAHLQAAWEKAVGPVLAKLSRPGNITRGALQIHVANSAAMQEIHFCRKQILSSLQASPVAEKITDLKIRIGQFD